MALTRKFLATMGIDGDKIDEIITAHTETVNGLKEERDNYKIDAVNYKKQADELKEVKKELDKLKGGENPYEEKYKTLKKNFDEFKNDVEKKEVLRNKKTAYKKLLKEIKVDEKRYDSILKVTDLTEYKLNDKGEFENADEIKKSIENEWSDFIVNVSVRGANTETPPANGGKGKTLDEIKAIKNTAERQQAYKEYYNNERK